jgi:hypothetical protein
MFKPSIHRKCFIDKKIREKTYPTASSLARDYKKEFGKTVDPRTIAGDIADMRRALNAPIKYDSEKRGYVYSNPSYTLNLLKNEATSLTSGILEKSVLEEAGFGTLPASDTFAQKLSARVSLLGFGAEDPRDTHAVLMNALVYNKELTVEHTTQSGTVSCPFKIFHCAFIKNNCFVFGEISSDTPVPYALISCAKILRAVPTGAIFTPPAHIRMRDAADNTVEAVIRSGNSNTVLVFSRMNAEEYELFSKTDIFKPPSI